MRKPVKRVKSLQVIMKLANITLVSEKLKKKKNQQKSNQKNSKARSFPNLSISPASSLLKTTYMINQKSMGDTCK